ncbi:MAG: hypothetical protein HOF69_04030 [Campylobacteraceae bacterium]|jgi:PBP1b-binding outer membrane lipoprotein LpoB|nr:hypothetical protein [Campylobacteraceae bacterium]MBT3882413.1 hypothetical protein [Campylobacteraceae bacterium]MBT4029959.1 hypothetical protein [Campylobacteraceae bacterium]MBT4178774.1 hypothetical protein [Campylobacteraceae bacterium]MBT4571870.1 hypothetical protein [Campylobacteraceae bacterium]
MKLFITILFIGILFSGCISSVQNMNPQNTKKFENSVKNMDEENRKSLMDKLVPLFISYENNRGQ